MLVLVNRDTRSSGESSAWMLHDGVGARLLGSPTAGMIEYGNVVPYVLPGSGLVINLPTKRNDYGIAVESVGFPVDRPLSDDVAAVEVATEFEALSA
jgi:C-terminal processing protease CtpA/Prc